MMFLNSPPLAMATTIHGQILVKAARDNSNAVIYIDKIPGKRYTAPSSPIVLDQINLKFVPHVLPVLVGTTVAFPNSDSCANEHRQDMRHKLEVYLIENDRAGWSGVSLPRYLIDVDNRIAVVTCGLDEDLAVDGGGHSQGRRI